MTTNLTTLKANVATLVADGASPTQGHVNTLNATLTAFVADVATIMSTLKDNNIHAKLAHGGVQVNLATNLATVIGLLS